MNTRDLKRAEPANQAAVGLISSTSKTHTHTLACRCQESLDTASLLTPAIRSIVVDVRLTVKVQVEAILEVVTRAKVDQFQDVRLEVHQDVLVLQSPLKINYFILLTSK